MLATSLPADSMGLSKSLLCLRYGGGASTQTATAGALAVVASTPQVACRSPTNVAGFRAGPQ